MSYTPLSDSEKMEIIPPSQNMSMTHDSVVCENEVIPP